MQIGSNIRTLRTQKNISQKQLASQLGITSVYLSMIENNAKRPSLTFMEKVSQFFGVPLAMLFTELTLAA